MMTMIVTVIPIVRTTPISVTTTIPATTFPAILVPSSFESVVVSGPSFVVLSPPEFIYSSIWFILWCM